MPDMTLEFGLGIGSEGQSQDSLHAGVGIGASITFSEHYITLTFGLNFTLTTRSDSGYLATQRYRE